MNSASNNSYYDFGDDEELYKRGVNSPERNIKYIRPKPRSVANERVVKDDKGYSTSPIRMMDGSPISRDKRHVSSIKRPSLISSRRGHSLAMPGSWVTIIAAIPSV